MNDDKGRSNESSVADGGRPPGPFRQGTRFDWSMLLPDSRLTQQPRDGTSLHALFSLGMFVLDELGSLFPGSRHGFGILNKNNNHACTLYSKHQSIKRSLTQRRFDWIRVGGQQMKTRAGIILDTVKNIDGSLLFCIKLNDSTLKKFREGNFLSEVQIQSILSSGLILTAADIGNSLQRCKHLFAIDGFEARVLAKIGFALFGLDNLPGGKFKILILFVFVLYPQRRKPNPPPTPFSFFICQDTHVPTKFHQWR